MYVAILHFAEGTKQCKTVLTGFFVSLNFNVEFTSSSNLSICFSSNDPCPSPYRWTREWNASCVRFFFRTAMDLLHTAPTLPWLIGVRKYTTPERRLSNWVLLKDEFPWYPYQFRSTLDPRHWKKTRHFKIHKWHSMCFHVYRRQLAYSVRFIHDTS